MGIAIQELLSQDYFKEFYVLAGAKGLHREIPVSYTHLTLPTNSRV